jgi:hypothetical protein
MDLRGQGKSPRWSDQNLLGNPGDVMVQEVLRAPSLRGLAHLPALYYRGVAEAAHAHLVDIQSQTAAERREIRRREWPNWGVAEIRRSCAAQEECDSRLVRNGNVIPTTHVPSSP